ncbi:hypothetical protein PYW07_015551 [Mythimna separata]|uniref:Uncharacterized protein n=1 Tax=Mythimna separata TaxID=271217 RepID=A0AAD7Z091_MYTSE|nr:hypothetical protein PYW07_015551 [Mythimna separata]
MNIVYDGCPRSFSKGVWWPRTKFGIEAVTDCPTGTSGKATRMCDETQVVPWQEPDMFNCTTSTFYQLRKQLSKIETGELSVNTFVGVRLAADLTSACANTPVLYGADVLVAEGILLELLQYEMRQAGLNLTHSQDKDYVRNVIKSANTILNVQYAKEWRRIRELTGHGMELLLQRFDKYIAVLAESQHDTYTSPFEINTSDLVIGVDIVTAESIYGFEPTQLNRFNIDSYTTERVVLPDTSSFIHSPIQTPIYHANGKINKHRKPSSPTVSFPKYNNYVKSKNKFDKYTRVLLPLDLLGITNSNIQENLDLNYESRAVFSYLQYSRNSSQLMPLRMDESVSQRWGVNITVGSPIIQLALFVPEYVWSKEASDEDNSLETQDDVEGKALMIYITTDESGAQRWGVNITVGSPIIQLALFVPEYVWSKEASDEDNSLETQDDVEGKALMIYITTDESGAQRWGVNITVGSPIIQLALFVPEYVWSKEASDEDNSLETQDDVEGKALMIYITTDESGAQRWGVNITVGSPIIQLALFVPEYVWSKEASDEDNSLETQDDVEGKALMIYITTDESGAQRWGVNITVGSPIIQLALFVPEYVWSKEASDEDNSLETQDDVEGKALMIYITTDESGAQRWGVNITVGSPIIQLALFVPEYVWSKEASDEDNSLETQDDVEGKALMIYITTDESGAQRWGVNITVGSPIIQLALFVPEYVWSKEASDEDNSLETQDDVEGKALMIYITTDESGAQRWGVNITVGSPIIQLALFVPEYVWSKEASDEDNSLETQDDVEGKALMIYITTDESGAQRWGVNITVGSPIIQLALFVPEYVWSKEASDEDNSLETQDDVEGKALMIYITTDESGAQRWGVNITVGSPIIQLALFVPEYVWSKEASDEDNSLETQDDVEGKALMIYITTDESGAQRWGVNITVGSPIIQLALFVPEYVWSKEASDEDNSLETQDDVEGKALMIYITTDESGAQRWGVNITVGSPIIQLALFVPEYVWSKEASDEDNSLETQDDVEGKALMIYITTDESGAQRWGVNITVGSPIIQLALFVPEYVWSKEASDEDNSLETQDDVEGKALMIYITTDESGAQRWGVNITVGSPIIQLALFVPEYVWSKEASDEDNSLETQDDVEGKALMIYITTDESGAQRWGVNITVGSPIIQLALFVPEYVWSKEASDEDNSLETQDDVEGKALMIYITTDESGAQRWGVNITVGSPIIQLALFVPEYVWSKEASDEDNSLETQDDVEGKALMIYITTDESGAQRWGVNITVGSPIIQLALFVPEYVWSKEASDEDNSLETQDDVEGKALMIYITTDESGAQRWGVNITVGSPIIQLALFVPEYVWSKEASDEDNSLETQDDVEGKALMIYITTDESGAQRWGVNITVGSPIIQLALFVPEYVWSKEASDEDNSLETQDDVEGKALMIYITTDESGAQRWGVNITVGSPIIQLALFVPEYVWSKEASDEDNSLETQDDVEGKALMIYITTDESGAQRWGVNITVGSPIIQLALFVPEYVWSKEASDEDNSLETQDDVEGKALMIYITTDESGAQRWGVNITVGSPIIQLALFVPEYVWSKEASDEDNSLETQDDVEGKALMIYITTDESGAQRWGVNITVGSPIIQLALFVPEYVWSKEASDEDNSLETQDDVEGKALMIYITTDESGAQRWGVNITVGSPIIQLALFVPEYVWSKEASDEDNSLETQDDVEGKALMIYITTDESGAQRWGVNITVGSPIIQLALFVPEYVWSKEASDEDNSLETQDDVEGKALMIYITTDESGAQRWGVNITVGSPIIQLALFVPEYVWSKEASDEDNSLETQDDVEGKALMIYITTDESGAQRWGVNITVGSPIIQLALFVPEYVWSKEASDEDNSLETQDDVEGKALMIYITTDESGAQRWGVNITVGSPIIQLALFVPEYVWSKEASDEDNSLETQDDVEGKALMIYITTDESGAQRWGVNITVGSPIIQLALFVPEYVWSKEASDEDNSLETQDDVEGKALMIYITTDESGAQRWGVNITVGSPIIQLALFVPEYVWSKEASDEDNSLETQDDVEGKALMIYITTDESGAQRWGVNITVGSPIIQLALFVPEYVWSKEASDEDNSLETQDDVEGKALMIYITTDESGAQRWGVNITVGSPIIQLALFVPEYVWSKEASDEDNSLETQDDVEGKALMIYITTDESGAQRWGVNITVGSPIIQLALFVPEYVWSKEASDEDNSLETQDDVEGKALMIYITTDESGAQRWGVNITVGSPIIQLALFVPEYVWSKEASDEDNSLETQDDVEGKALMIYITTDESGAQRWGVNITVGSPIIQLALFVPEYVWSKEASDEDNSLETQDDVEGKALMIYITTDESGAQRWGVNITVGSPIIQLALFVPEYVWSKEASDEDNSLETQDDVEGKALMIYITTDESGAQRWGVNITVGSPIIQLALFVPEYVWSKEASDEDNSLETQDDVEGKALMIYITTDESGAQRWGVNITVGSPIIQLALFVPEYVWSKEASDEDNSLETQDDVEGKALMIYITTDESGAQRWGVNITVGSPIIQLALFVPEYVWSKEASDEDNSLETQDDVEGIIYANKGNTHHQQTNHINPNSNSKNTWPLEEAQNHDNHGPVLIQPTFKKQEKPFNSDDLQENESSYVSEKLESNEGPKVMALVMESGNVTKDGAKKKLVYKSLSGIRLKRPIRLQMWLDIDRETFGSRTNPQCVHWSTLRGSGEWSRVGCHTEIDYDWSPYSNEPLLINCTCNHLSTFAVLVDEVDIEFIPEPSLLESVTSYTAFSISLPLLLTTWTALCLMRGGAATVSNSIHKHLIFCVFMAELLYLIALKARSSLVQNEVSHLDIMTFIVTWFRVENGRSICVYQFLFR